MKSRRCVVLLSLFCALPAAADPKADADAHLAAAVALAAEGRNHEAIARFKAAERSYPRAEHDCNIALVYLRLENWHRAHFFLSRCDARKPAERPAWIDRRRVELVDRFQSTHGQIVMEVAPPSARVFLSAFAPDEGIAGPATVWVPRGSVSARISAPGYETQSQKLSVGAYPTALKVRLEKVKPTPVTVAKPPAVKVSPKPAPTVVRVEAPEPETPVAPWVLIGAGVAAGVAGGLLHVSALDDEDEAAKLVRGTDDWQDVVDRRDRKDVAAVSLYAVGGAAVVGGLVWLLWPEAEAVAVGPAGVGWRLSWR